MKTYTVRVTERHTDTIIVKAETPEQARQLAAWEAVCIYECVEDAEIISEE